MLYINCGIACFRVSYNMAMLSKELQLEANASKMKLANHM